MSNFSTALRKAVPTVGPTSDVRLSAVLLSIKEAVRSPQRFAFLSELSVVSPESYEKPKCEIIFLSELFALR